MRVLVTGAAGYLGQAVVEALCCAGHEPVALVHRKAPRGFPAGVEVRVGDLLTTSTLVSATADVDAVCHLAGLTRARESWNEALQYFQVNAGGTLAVLEAMRDAGVRLLVFASTGAIYHTPEPPQPMHENLPDAPPHPYAASKLAAESAIEWQARGGQLGALVLRLFNVAGRVDPDPTRIIPRALAAASGRASHLEVNGDGNAVRDFLHVTDAAEAFVAGLEHVPAPGTARRYNIGAGVGVSMLEVITAVERVTGKTVRVIHRPPAAEPAALVCDPSRAMAELDWKPRHSELGEIIRDACAAFGIAPISP